MRKREVGISKRKTGMTDWKSFSCTPAQQRQGRAGQGRAEAQHVGAVLALAWQGAYGSGEGREEVGAASMRARGDERDLAAPRHPPGSPAWRRFPAQPTRGVVVHQL